MKTTTNKLMIALIIWAVIIGAGIIYLAFFSPKAQQARSNMESWNTIPAYAEPYLKSTEYTSTPLPDNTLRVELTREEAVAIKRLSH